MKHDPYVSYALQKMSNPVCSVTATYVLNDADPITVPVYVIADVRAYLDDNDIENGTVDS